MKLKWLDWFVYLAIAAGLVGGFWYFTARASAQSWPPTRSCEWRGDCRAVYLRQRARERHRRAERVYSYEKREQRCEAVIAVTGEEKYGTGRAKEAADSIWAERAKFLFGVRFMDLKNARHLTYECGRSSTGKRASEAVAGAAGQVLEQCELKATPCRAEAEGGER